MNIAYFPNQIARNAGPVLDAFLQSCRYHGIDTVQDSLDADMAVIWSHVWAGRMRGNQQIWESYRSTNRNVVVLEVGGIQRNTTWRVGLNGVNGTANFGTGSCHSNRAQQLGLQLLPWRQHGKYIVICAQRSDSEQWRGQPELEYWIDSTITTIKTHTDRPIIIRPHPRFRLKKQWDNVGLQFPKHIVGTHDSFDFESSIANAWAVFNWNSNPGVQAIINGVPAFVDSSSLAAPVANLDWSLIENPWRPDREQWLNNLAWTEWTIEEIRQGIPLLRLMLAQPSQTSI